MFLGNSPGTGEQDIRETAGRLYDLYAPRLLSLCMRYCGNRDDAEDVLHDGFLKIFTHLDRFRSRHPASLEAWMKRIMVNTALNFLRDQFRGHTLVIAGSSELMIDTENDDADHGSLPQGIEVSKEQLMEMVCSLPAGYRTVFNLYVMESWTHKNIAKELGCTEGTSKSQLSKARSFLRKRLNELINEKQYGTAKVSCR